MAHDALRAGLQDVAFTIATPFDEDDRSVREDAIRENVTGLIDRGARLFIPCGNTGEYYALSHQERCDVVAATADAAGDDCTVVAGAAGSIPTVLDLAAEYEAAGVDGLMLMDLDHTYVHRDGVVDYVEAIASETDLGIISYKRSPVISLSALSEIATIDNVVGVKYAVNDVKGFATAVNELPEDFIMLNGIAERFAPSFALEGAQGFTTGIGNFVPEATLALHDALVDEDWEEAIRIRNLVKPFEDLREEVGGGSAFPAANNVPAVKYAMDLAGFTGGPVRPPLRELSDADKDRAEEYYERIDAADF